MKDKKFLYVAIGGAVVAVAVAYHLFSTGFFEKNESAVPSMENDTTDGNVDLQGLGLEVGDSVVKDGYTIERLPDAEAAFNFDRAIPESGGHVDGDARVQAVTNLKALIANLKSNPDQFNVWLSLGVYRLILGDGVGAVIAWQHTAKLYPSAWEPHLNIGNYFRDNGDAAKAKLSYEAALERAEATGDAELTAGIQKELDTIQ